MDELITLVLEGTLTTVTGLASSVDSVKEENGKYQALPRMRAKRFGLDRSLGGGTPIIRSTTLTGSLRRAIMDQIEKAAARKRRPQEGSLASLRDIHAWFWNRQGGVAGFSGFRYQEIPEIRRKNPVVSLYGAAGLAGRVGVSHAICQMDAASAIAREYGYRSDDMARQGDLQEQLPQSFWEDYLILQHGKGGNEAMKEAQFALGAPAKDTKLSREEVRAKILCNQQDPSTASTEEDRTGGSPEEAEQDEAESRKGFVSILNPYAGFEYYRPGVTFSHQILCTVTRTEAAFLLGSLYAFAAHPVLGGHLRQGMGWVDLRYSIYSLPDDPLLVRRYEGDLWVNPRVSDLCPAPLAAADGSTIDQSTSPGFSVTGELPQQLLAQFLQWRDTGFADFDFNAGAEHEKKTILESKGKTPKSKKTAGAKPKKGKEPEPDSSAASPATTKPAKAEKHHA